MSAPVVNSYFSGMGLVDLGLQRGGLQIGQSFELDRTCCETQRLNFDHEVRRCDLTQKLALEEDACDVKVFTYPCTKYSAIADIHDARTGDELFLHALRHMVMNPPEVFAVENVPGMRMFPVVMEAMTKLPGYFVTSFCPVNASLWLPQNRERLIIFGSRRPFAWRAPESRRRAPSLASILERHPEVELPKYVGRRLRGKYRDQPIISDPRRGDIAPTCVAHYAKDLSTRLVRDRRFAYGARPYSVREWARLQGVPDWFRFAGGGRAAYRMTGNAVPEPMANWMGREIVRYFEHRRAA